MRFFLVVTIGFTVLFSCETNRVNEGDLLVNATIKKYGLAQLKGRAIMFDFRNRKYISERTADQYIYYRVFKDSLGRTVEDKLINSTQFSRSIDNKPIVVSREMQRRYGNSINSVLYFFQLPYGLNDKAANKKWVGTQVVNGQKYQLVSVLFDQEGGGKDYDDKFLYWIHDQTKMVDYLAYSYSTDGGGVRFRAAINRREITGMLFQDYINFKPLDESISLKELAGLYERKELKELSRIISKNIVVKQLSD